MDHLKHNSGIILFPKKVAYKKIDDLCAEPIWMVQYICASSRPDSLFNLPFFWKKILAELCFRQFATQCVVLTTQRSTDFSTTIV